MTQREQHKTTPMSDKDRVVIETPKGEVFNFHKRYKKQAAAIISDEEINDMDVDKKLEKLERDQFTFMSQGKTLQLQKQA